MKQLTSRPFVTFVRWNNGWTIAKYLSKFIISSALKEHPPIIKWTKACIPLRRHENCPNKISLANTATYKGPQITPIATIVVKSPWDTRHKYLTELPVVSYCYQIIVLSTHSLTLSPLSPKINVELNMYEVFSPTAILSRGEGGWTTFLHGTWNLIIKL